MATPAPLELVATVLFALAVVHTFATRRFDHLAHVQPRHAGLWHLLGEIEIAFGFWALVLLVVLSTSRGWGAVGDYMGTLHFTEPVFVFVVMVVAASRPILQLARGAVDASARLLPMSAGRANFVVALSLVPLLGSFVTEPAAMTLAALMLRDGVFARPVSKRLKYATLAVLFVNVSIGGTLTHFAAPPVLMVAGKWGWTTGFMFAHFGWKAVLAVLVNTALLAVLFRRELAKLDGHAGSGGAATAGRPPVPPLFVLVNAALLLGIVAASHRPEIFMGLFLLFLGLAEAYGRHHDRLILRQGLMVGFFLAGLVVLGGMQSWWLQPLIAGLDRSTLYFGAASLTAVTDNAALTYLGSQVSGLSESLRYSLVAGAVAGGGLTVIANAPNPAGWSILEERFEEGSINPFGLVVAALPPTLVALTALRAPGGLVMEIQNLAQLRTWLAELDRGILFLFLLPFVVAAFALIADWARARRAARRGREIAPSPASPGVPVPDPGRAELPSAESSRAVPPMRPRRPAGSPVEARDREEELVGAGSEGGDPPKR